MSCGPQSQSSYAVGPKCPTSEQLVEESWKMIDR
jgi:hypothetical protein